MDHSEGAHRLGIRENWVQFALLVLINVCVGGMVGLERTVVPLVAIEEFHRAAAAHVNEVNRLQASVSEHAALVAELEDALRVA